jgi:hypothetical protein
MTAPPTSKPALIPCPECNKLVAEHNMKRHKNRVHSPERIERDRIATQTRSLTAILERYRMEDERRLRTETICPTCNLKIQIGQIKSHFGNVHSAPAPENLLALLGETPPRDRFRSDREREQYWRAFEGVSDAQPSEDLFDRTKVVQGGAYGLGKSRKN